MNIAVVGATGLVGGVLLQELESNDFTIKPERVLLFASERSSGKKMEFCGERLDVLPLHNNEIPEVDVAFFCVEPDISRRYAPLFIEKGAVVIDKSSAFRKTPDIPLIVPEVNADAIGDAKLIACPNCSTIQLVVVLAPLKKFGMRFVSVATYQAISGAGREAIIRFIEEWEDTWDWFEGADLLDLVGQHPYPETNPPALFANVIPEIGRKLDDGYFAEENKLRYETRRILDMPELPLSATAVRIPVLNVHSEAVSVEFDKPMKRNDIVMALSSADGVVITEHTPTPAYVSGRREVFVGRIRIDPDRKNVVHLWIAADNLRKGAATNAIQIAEQLI